MVQELPLESRYEIDITWSDEDEAFVARIPDLPFAGAHGATSEEALAMAKSAIRAYLEVAEDSGKPIPEPGEYARDRKAIPTGTNVEIFSDFLEQQRAIQGLLGASVSVYADLLNTSISAYQSYFTAISSLLQASSEIPARAALDSVVIANEAVQEAVRTVNRSAEQVARAANEATLRAAQEAGGRAMKRSEEDATNSAPTTS